MSTVHRIAELNVSFDAAAHVLESQRDLILTGDDTPAHLSMEADLLGVTMEHDVVAEVGELVNLTEPIEAAVLPFRLEAVDHPRLFPSLEGELEIVAAAGGVEIALEGQCHVPGGPVGAVVEAAGMHHIVEESIDRFFAAVVERIRRGSEAYDALTGVPI